jgi:predicted nucleic acid-binding protein
MNSPHKRKSSTWDTKTAWLNSPPFLTRPSFILRHYATSSWNSPSRTFTEQWSGAVHEEWIKSVLLNRSDLTREKLERTRDLMNAHVRDALVVNFEGLINVLDLPDPDDRHVVAAAIKGRADLIVTHNLRDFPAAALEPWGIEAQHPDEFLTHQFYLSQPVFLQAVKTVRLRLKRPPKSVEDYLDILRVQGLLATVNAIEPFDQFI